MQEFFDEARQAAYLAERSLANKQARERVAQ